MAENSAPEYRLGNRYSTKDSIETRFPEAVDGLEAIGVRGERTAKQPENFGTIISKYPMITLHVARLARFRWSRSKQLKSCDSSYGHNASYRSHAGERKNWLFIGSLRARVRNASLMSLVASALRMDLDVGRYFESVLTHMLRGTAKTVELLPVRWTAAHLSGGARVPRTREAR